MDIEISAYLPSSTYSAFDPNSKMHYSSSTCIRLEYKNIQIHIRKTNIYTICICCRYTRSVFTPIDIVYWSSQKLKLKPKTDESSVFLSSYRFFLFWWKNAYPRRDTNRVAHELGRRAFISKTNYISIDGTPNFILEDIVSDATILMNQ